jgi:two-component system sensor histidine kinase DctS
VKSPAAILQTYRPVAPRRRRLLWLLLVSLVVILLVILVWLAGRYEASQVQDRLERDATEAVTDIRTALTRNVQSLNALQFNAPTPAEWALLTQSLLREHRELVQIEWRDTLVATRSQQESPFHPPVFARLGRDSVLGDVAQACAAARKNSGPAYTTSYFVPLAEGLGLELMDVCLPVATSGKLTGFLVATYSLQGVLDELAGRPLTRSQEVSFTEADGTRLAVISGGTRGRRIFTAQQLLDLPGNTLVFRMNSWRGAPDVFPNVLTALVTGLVIALISVLALLAKDFRRRLKAEHDLGDALAFRKAMEDSLVTGLRARDLQGQTTYVNPAFCQMVGFGADELLQSKFAPYWPSTRVDEYAQRQAIRLAGNVPPREGFESVFMRKNGSLFPVLIIEAPLINAQGEQTGWMSAFLDISEQRRVEELSRASQERLQATARLATVGEMASLLSHELNQPLAAISSYAAGSVNLLRDARGQQTESGSDHQLELEGVMLRIAEQAERAGKVIKSVNDFVRRREQVRETLAPQALFDAVLPLVSLQARKLSVRVETRIEADLPQVICDRTMVEQVLLNLTRNAMQSMDRPEISDRVLTLRAHRIKNISPDGTRSGWLAFSVSDVGFGIPPEVKQQLFTPFFTTKAEGMGLGLSLCRTVVEQHGGALVFEPNLPQGTVFTFTLAAAASPAVQ